MKGIYKITNPSGKVYIGQSKNIRKRWNSYKSMVQCVEYQRLLYNSFEKYSVENHKFEICHELPVDVEQEVLDRYEQFYMDCYRDCGIELLNLREGGKGGTASEETKRKMSASLKGKNTWSKGRKHSEETKKKLSELSKGRIFSIETRKRLSDKHLGKKMSQSARKKMSDAQKGNTKRLGKFHSEETKKKISDSKKRISSFL